MKRKSSEVPSSGTDRAPKSDGASARQGEDIDLDDQCPICHLLLYRPVRTRCNHTLCESCMAHWADVSITSQMTTVGLDDRAVVLLPNEIETRCPMCRTPTTASLDTGREMALRQSYPVLYQSREAESRTVREDDFGSSIETLTVYIGNEHSLIRTEGESNNKHHWKFFVRPSRTDLIEEVQIFLVRLISPSRHTQSQQPSLASHVPEPSRHCPISALRNPPSWLGVFHNLC